jgi:hypothetical protein
MTEANDHDILIELKTRMQLMSSDLKEIKEQTASRLNSLSSGKTDKASTEDWRRTSEKMHEKYDVRITRLERFMWAIYGMFALAEIGKFILERVGVLH